MKGHGIRIMAVVFCLSALVWAGSANVILMISDGCGFNQFDAASYYQYGSRGCQPYDSDLDYAKWTRVGCTTYPENSGYNPEKMWSSFKYQESGPTDSAAASSAINTGVKYKNGYMNIDSDGNRHKTFAQYAVEAGLVAGTVTTVPMGHATPAGVWSHNFSRGHAREIVDEMVFNSRGLNCVIGAGHPYYDNNGQKLDHYRNGTYTPEPLTFEVLTRGIQGWTFTDDTHLIKSLSIGENLPKRLFAVPRVGDTFQCNRDGQDMGNLNQNLPTLAECSLAALNVLDQNEKGFYILIEGGAIDWAGHANNLARNIEEQLDFNRAVSAVISWVEQYSSWDETLLIITADHECGCLWGERNKFAAVKSRGEGELPEAFFHSGGHTNQLVPLWAIGRGSEMFRATEIVDGKDVKAAEVYKTLTDWDGSYVDNTDIFTVMKSQLN